MASADSLDTTNAIREHLVWLLTKGNAHMTFEEAIAGFPEAAMNTRFPNGSYSPWHLVEHLRRTQYDILDFIRNPDYQEMEWPKDYWPAENETATQAQWDRTITQFLADRQALVELVLDMSRDLYTPIPWGTGQNVLKEILVVADHNAYHVGEFAIMRQVMGTWGAAHSAK